MELLTKSKKSAQVEKPKGHNPDISALAQFQPGSKNSNLISKIKKLRARAKISITTFAQWILNQIKAEGGTASQRR